MISKCTCIHKFQNDEHGRGSRVFVTCKGGDRMKCTVCGAEKDVPKYAKKGTK